MANEEHLKILKQGVEQWNKWYLENAIRPNLSGADLSDADLGDANLCDADLSNAILSNADLSNAILTSAQMSGANLSSAKLSSANLSGANLGNADLSNANLSGANLNSAFLMSAKLRDADLKGAELFNANLRDADLSNADLNGANILTADLNSANLSSANLSSANLSGAHLHGSNLSSADLSDANLSDADLSFADLSKSKLRSANAFGVDLQGTNLTSADLTDADLSCADLVETDFTNAIITGCRTYGASAWNVTLVGTVQHNLVITKWGEPVVTVDDLEVGQFIYLILNNTKIRNVIDTITSKGVLILGRFSDPQRKSVLDGLREGLRNFDLLPIVFDFDRPTDKDYTETVQTLAGMSMFVIADVTNPKSTPLELEATVKQLKIPYIPIIDTSVDPRPFAMLVDSQKSFNWVLPTRQYESKEDLLDGDNLKTYIIDPALAKREQLREAKNQEPETILIPKKGDSR
jgi:uncharacterized protein YjbI with pentapeptide repeats